MASCTCAGSGCPPPTLGIFGEARGASLGRGFKTAALGDLGIEGAFEMGAAAVETKAASFGVAPLFAFAAGAADNTAENLRLWIQNPDAIKPGSLMPAMKLNDADLDALVRYLRTLE